MGGLIRLCLGQGEELWFIPLAERWRKGVVEKFNDHDRGGFWRKIGMKSADELGPQSLLFEQKHNSRYRYSKLQGKTPLAVFQQSLDLIRFPDSDTPPRHPLPKPQAGRYHSTRFIRSTALLHVFPQHLPLPPPPS